MTPTEIFKIQVTSDSGIALQHHSDQFHFIQVSIILDGEVRSQGNESICNFRGIVLGFLSFQLSAYKLYFKK